MTQSNQLVLSVQYHSTVHIWLVHSFSPSPQVQPTSKLLNSLHHSYLPSLTSLLLTLRILVPFRCVYLNYIINFTQESLAILLYTIQVKTAFRFQAYFLIFVFIFYSEILHCIDVFHTKQYLQTFFVSQAY